VKSIVRSIVATVLVVVATSSAFAQSWARSWEQKDIEFNPAGLEQMSMQSISCTGFWRTPTWSCTKIVVPIYLAKAQNGNRSALVLIGHGSGGLDKRNSDEAAFLASKGINAAVIDHWTPRGLSKVQLDFKAGRAKGGDSFNMTFDILAATSQFKAMPEWKDVKVGFMGGSMGGTAAIFVSRPFTKALVAEETGLVVKDVDAIVALYPGCVDRNVDDRYLPIPTLGITGSKDDDTLADVCVRHFEFMNQRGASAQFKILPGEYHNFDATYRVIYSRDAQNTANCENVRDGAFTTLLSNGKQYPANKEGYAAMRATCEIMGTWNGRIGERTGYDLFLAFFTEKLLNKP
jgi:dienelactone hydrolase